nr:retrovirus-related Pol polyprotein from transposon TNT 1-94 [Tanacetum cinerariifolium]
MARASSTKSWLWHQCLSHLNFDTINDLARNDLVAGLLKFKYHKEHLCPSCEQGKSKRASHPPKPIPNSRKGLHLLHIDLCGPMRIASINGKRYILVIVDDYSRYTWVHFLRFKDEALAVIITFLKRITVLLQSPVIIIRTDNGTEFKNQVLKAYFDFVGISHQMSSVRTPQQNEAIATACFTQNRSIIHRRRTLVEAARTMLIFSRAPLFLWAEAITTACFTQNHSIIHRRFKKTPYELINGRKPDISFLHVFGALCYPKNDREDIGKLGAKGDMGFFIGYSADSCAYKIYNRRIKKIMETMNVSFDDLSAMAFEQRSSKPGLQSMTSGQISSELDLTYAPSTITKQQPTEGELDLLFEAMYDDYFGGQPSATVENVPPAQEPQVRQSSTDSTTIADNRIDTSEDSVMGDASNQGRMIDDLDKDDVVALMDDKEEEKKEEERLLLLLVKQLLLPVQLFLLLSHKDPEKESTTIIPADTKSKDKGKGIMVEETKPQKKKQQVEMDEEYARKLHEELNKDIDWDMAIEHVKQKAKEDPVVQRYQVMKKRPQIEAQARKNMIM